MALNYVYFRGALLACIKHCTMRSIVLCFMFLLAVAGLQAQERALLGLQFDYTYFDEEYHPSAGIELEGSFGRYFSLSYSVLYGPSGSDQYYFYTGGGQALGVYLIDKAIREGNGLALAIPLGMASFVLPESIAFRVPLSAKSEIAFFLAPYGYELIGSGITDERERKTSLELGIRYYWAVNQWMVLIPRIGAKAFYGEEKTGGALGVALMFRMDKE